MFASHQVAESVILIILEATINLRICVGEEEVDVFEGLCKCEHFFAEWDCRKLWWHICMNWLCKSSNNLMIPNYKELKQTSHLFLFVETSLFYNRCSTAAQMQKWSVLFVWQRYWREKYTLDLRAIAHSAINILKTYHITFCCLTLNSFERESVTCSVSTRNRKHLKNYVKYLTLFSVVLFHS